MNREAIEKWADACEFDDIQQGFLSLVEFSDEDNQEKYGLCGLGVACKVYADIHGVDVLHVTSGAKRPTDQLPSDVADWLDIDPSTQSEIVNLNDIEEISLPEIGTWIRDNILKEE